MNQIRAILWAQWRTARNFYARGGVTATAIFGAVWYGLWVVASVALGRLFAAAEELDVVRVALPGGLLLVFLYWQVVPLLLAATGASLELQKLRPYPVPTAYFFSIEAALRLTAGIEMVLLLTGVSVGVVFNPALPAANLLTIPLYVLFNLFLAVGLRDLLARMLARKRIRELVFLLLVICAGLPQWVLMRLGRNPAGMTSILKGDAWNGWPWTAAARMLLAGRDSFPSLAILLAWTASAGIFGIWQFSRTLTFDAVAARASGSEPVRAGLLDRLFRLPSRLLRDPLGVLIEKEIRFLTRSPRFRLVFLMGFTFGLVVWLPMALRRGNSHSFMQTNYLTVVSVYSVLLLGDVCFWNSFGFDRSAAQMYFLAPVPFSQVLIAKNLGALFFIVLEISAVSLVCALLGMPVNPSRLAEAYLVAGVTSIFLLAAGNVMSIRQARGVNPAATFRANAAGRIQAMLFVIYPVAFLPAGLAYLARYAFDSEPVFFGVLVFDGAMGLILYRIALDSSVAAAELGKEKMVAALSAGDGPIAN